jgi:hypothetical protein
VFFAAATLLATWPLARRLSAALPDPWDGKLTAWILHWDFHQTFRAPLRLFDANIFYPARDALAFSENLYGVSLFGFPLYAAGLSTLATSNLLFLLGMFLSALAAWALAREVTGDPAASLLAGLVYAFLPWRLSQLPHLQFQWGAFLPLLLLFLLRYLEEGRRRDLLLFGGCFVWNALCNIHYALFSGVLVALVLGFHWLRGPEEAGRRIARVILAAAAAGILVSPFFVPYWRVAHLEGMKRHLAEVEAFSARPDDFLSSGVRNKLYGASTLRFSHPEGDLFPGLVPVGLALYAAARLRRRSGSETGPATSDSQRRRRASRALDAALVILLLLWCAATARPGLRLGPVKLGEPGRILVFAAAVILVRLAIAFPRGRRYRDLGDFLRRSWGDPRALLLVIVGMAGLLLAFGARTPLYRFLFQSLGFVFHAIRAPARFIVLFHLAFAVLSAWGLSLLAGRSASRRRAAVIGAGILLVGMEYRAFPLALHSLSAEPPAIYRWLANAAVPPGVMEWPLGNEFDFEYEFRSTAHWKALVNGASGFIPEKYRVLWDEVRRNPIRDQVWERAQDVNASLLVLHPHDAPRGLLQRYVDVVRRGLAEGRLQVLAAFAHGPATDYVFRLTTGAAFDAGIAPEELRRAAERWNSVAIRPGPGPDPSPPLVYLEYPRQDAEVEAGAWAYGWAADDAGIEEVRIGAGSGATSRAAYGGPRPDVGRVIPQIPGSAQSGFGFAIPSLPPGPQVLTITVVSRDGGETVLRRSVRLLPHR